MWRRPPRLLRYAVAIGVTGLGFLLKLVLGPIIVPSVFLTAYAGVLIAAAFGGFGPGALATILSALLDTYFFLPLHGPAADAALVPLRVGLFIVVALTLSWVAAALGSTRQRIRAAEERHRSLLAGLQHYATFILRPHARTSSSNT